MCFWYICFWELRNFIILQLFCVFSTVVIPEILYTMNVVEKRKKSLRNCINRHCNVCMHENTSNKCSIFVSSPSLPATCSIAFTSVC